MTGVDLLYSFGGFYQVVAGIGKYTKKSDNSMT